MTNSFRRTCMIGLVVVGFALLVAIVLFEGREWVWIRASAGDVIVVWPIYAVLALAFPYTRPVVLALGTLGLAFAIEFSQLYHAPMIDRVRATLVGRLMLGNAFAVSDLGCYTIGVAVAFAFDTLLARRFDRAHVARATSP